MCRHCVHLYHVAGLYLSLHTSIDGGGLLRDARLPSAIAGAHRSRVWHRPGMLRVHDGLAGNPTRYATICVERFPAPEASACTVDRSVGLKLRLVGTLQATEI